MNRIQFPIGQFSIPPPPRNEIVFSSRSIFRTIRLSFLRPFPYYVHYLKNGRPFQMSLKHFQSSSIELIVPLNRRRFQECHPKHIIRVYVLMAAIIIILSFHRHVETNGRGHHSMSWNTFLLMWKRTGRRIRFLICAHDKSEAYTRPVPV